jgi:hypothetical protein
MGRSCITNGEKRNACKVLVRNPEGKRPLGRTRCGCEDNIKIDIRETAWGTRDCNHLAQDRDQSRVLAKKKKEFLESVKYWKILE